MGGFQAIGEHGYVQVDDTYQNLFLALKANPTYSNGFGYVHYYGGSAGIRPTPAIRSTALCSLGGVIWQDNHWVIILVGGTPTNTTVYVYDVLMGSDSKYGLVVYNAALVPTFDALKKPMTLVQPNISYGDSPGSIGSNSPPEPAGRLWAWILGIPSYHEYPRYNGPGTFIVYENVGGLQITNGVIGVADVMVGNRYVSNSTAEVYRTGSYAIIDVTYH